MSEVKNLYTLDEFCMRNSTTRRRLDRLWALGIGPKKTYVNARVVISAKDEQAWLDALDQPTGRVAKVRAQTEAMLAAKAAQGVVASLKARGVKA
jgi:hypothetical protein